MKELQTDKFREISVINQRSILLSFLLQMFKLRKIVTVVLC